MNLIQEDVDVEGIARDMFGAFVEARDSEPGETQQKWGDLREQERKAWRACAQSVAEATSAANHRHAFAALAMQGLLAGHSAALQPLLHPEELPPFAYRIADEMIATSRRHADEEGPRASK